MDASVFESLPPPPPLPAQGTNHGDPPSPSQQQQDQQQRRRVPVQPPTLLTSLAASHLRPQQTPASAHPSHTPYSPIPMSARATPTVVSAYNPQEWSRNQHVGGSFMPHSASPQAGRAREPGTQEISGLEAALPSPPPPYSASPSSSTASPSAAPPAGSRQQQYHSISQAVSPSRHASEYNTPISAATTSSSSSQTYNRSFSPPTIAAAGQQQSSPGSFPPPPPRDRSGSRSRFNLGPFTSRSRAHDAPSSSNAMDTLQQQTTEAIARAPQAQWPTAVVLQAAMQPPGARRAASTGAISHGAGGQGADHTRQIEAPPSSHGQGQNHGHALPPPPPGPPPNGSRSQSLSRYSEIELERDAAAPVAVRRGAAQGSRLGPVPRTPADWIDDDATVPDRASTRQPSALNTHAQDGLNAATRQKNFPRATNSQREGGIRERRSQSRANKNMNGRSASREPQTAIELTTDPWAAVDGEAKPANLVLQSQDGVLGRRRHVSKSKTSPLFRQAVSPEMSRRRDEANEVQTGASSLPRVPPNTVQATPPMSAGTENDRSLKMQRHGEAQNRGMPTPLSARSANVASPSTGSILGDRSVVTSPSTVNSPVPVYVPSRTNSKNGKDAATSVVIKSAFGQTSLDRYRQFLEQETAAASDQHRLELFADFIVYESRLRRDRYSAAFDALGSDVLELTRDMWKPLVSKRVQTPTSAVGSVADSNAGRIASRAASLGGDVTPAEPLSASSHPYTPRTEPESPVQINRMRSDSRQNTYQPCLSPIPSMAMSTVRDDESSRGRTASRWWEASTHLSESVGGARRVERSKRESKYMGLPREARENLQWDGVEQPTADGEASSQHQYAYGPNEYPPEKVGWHEQPEAALASSYSQAQQQTPRTPKVPQMDVSRLINLPPPYPRHHPAVNNSHPDLSSIRGSLRELSERNAARAAAESYDARPGRVDLSSEAAVERKRELRRRIHDKVTSGDMSYAEAARAEEEFASSEAQLSCDAAQKDFDDFQKLVKNKMSAAFTERVNRATSAIDQLSDNLSEAARSHDPNSTQEEGDEKPELLEKLTLMKWLFEAREQLFLDLYLLESSSDDKYKQVILTPYRLASADDKIQEVESFFLKDSNDRRLKYQSKARKRYEAFLQVVEKSVTRGVESQLSAFWDIAPSLLELVQRVPNSLHGFDVEIPNNEYAENPSYNDYPLQYLFTLLLHTEKSTYQFIESQTNLLCLLHEIKTGVMSAGSRLLETERYLAGENQTMVAEEMKAAREEEDARLTRDLKERVGLIEEQWKDALGNGLLQCKSKVREHLVEQGGWDEALLE